MEGVVLFFGYHEAPSPTSAGPEQYSYSESHRIRCGEIDSLARVYCAPKTTQRYVRTARTARIAAESTTQHLHLSTVKLPLTPSKLEHTILLITLSK